MIVDLVLLVGWLFALVLYFGKRPGFPRTYIVLTVSMVAWMVVRAALSALAFGVSEVLATGAVRDIFGAAVFAAIWVPYMLTSERVRNTFVESA